VITKTATLGYLEKRPFSSKRKCIKENLCFCAKTVLKLGIMGSIVSTASLYIKIIILILIQMGKIGFNVMVAHPGSIFSAKKRREATPL
jgi:hypothetical protein